jgi:hypothetical protein
MQAFFSSIYLLALLLSLLASSCISTTRFGKTAASPVRLDSTDKILVLPIPSVPNMSTSLYVEAIKKRFARQGIAIAYVPEEEYMFATAGIKYPFGPADYDSLYKKGYTYVLGVQVQGLQAATSISNTYTDYEVNQRDQGLHPHLGDEMVNKANLRLELFSNKEKQTVYSLGVRTRISPLSFRRRDGGETDVNLSNTGMAAGTALTKGVKRILKKCS